MFCPNCGTQNESAATPCKKCGFKLSGISVPKFKGTMMLNSDQTVQELIEEHRKKAQEVAAEKSKGRASEPAPKRAPGSSAPPSSLGGAKGPVLQPPRAAARGRMGGTMLGVAPQAGGVLPPAGARAPAGPPPVTPAVAPAEAEPGRTEAPTPELAAGPEASEPAPAPVGAWAESAPRPQLEPDLDDERTPRATASAAAAPALTRPLAAVPGSPAHESSAPADGSDRVSDDAADPPERPEPAPGRPVAVTAPVLEQPEPSATADLAEAKRSLPPRIRALDVVLIVCTFGLYGIVLWLKRRKPVAA